MRFCKQNKNFVFSSLSLNLGFFFKIYFREINSNDDALSHLHIDRNFITSTIDNVTASIDNDWRSVSLNPGDKLHRVGVERFFKAK
jgi:hypothetical protein